MKNELTHSAALVLPLAAGLLIGCLAGCAEWGYDKIQIGQYREAYENVLPASRTRETTLGLCYYDVSSTGTTQGIFVFLTHQKRVAGKLMARAVEREFLPARKLGYELSGEIDQNIAGFSDTGPVDTLRAFIADMAAFSGERVSREANHWLAAGLIRLLQAAPGGADVAGDYPNLAETLERVPAGGSGQIQLDNGVIRFSYQQGSLK